MPSAFAVLRLITKVSLLACSIGRSPGLGASKEERHLVPSTLIRQYGCPNYIKFRMTLNGIQNRDLSWHTREMRHG